MTILPALLWGVKKLNHKKIASANLDAEVLLAWILKKDKEFLYTHPEKNLTAEQLKKFKLLISQREKMTPVAYLIGQKEFFGLNFKVNKNVLIPRPETETLVIAALDFLRRQRILSPQIVEAGAGSGCIAIALKKNWPKAKITATEISPSALILAPKNAKKNKVKIKFLPGDLLEPIKNQKIDLLLANLPYLKNQFKNSSQFKKSGLKFEPKTALFGGPDGLKFYRQLFFQLKKKLLKPKMIICEIDGVIAAASKSLARQFFAEAKIEIKNDLAGKNRLLIINLSNSNFLPAAGRQKLILTT